MKWEELTEKHAQEYVAYLNGYKESLERLNEDRKKVLETANCTEENIPTALNNVLNRDIEGWRDEWGMYGSKFKEMRVNQRRELNQHFFREGLIYHLKKEINTGKEQQNDNS